MTAPQCRKKCIVPIDSSLPGAAQGRLMRRMQAMTSVITHQGYKQSTKVLCQGTTAGQQQTQLAFRWIIRREGLRLMISALCTPIAGRGWWCIKADEPLIPISIRVPLHLKSFPPNTYALHTASIEPCSFGKWGRSWSSPRTRLLRQAHCFWLI